MSRVTIISDPHDATACALVLSISHVVADGHRSATSTLSNPSSYLHAPSSSLAPHHGSYYKVLQQLSETEELRPLNAVRKQQYTALQIAAQGEKDYNFM